MGNRRVNVSRFTNASEVLAAAMSRPHHLAGRTNPEFYGDDSASAVKSACRSGHAKSAAAVERIMDRIEAALPVSERPTIEASYVPGYVCVGDALSGSPEAFRRRVQTADDTAPVRFIVDLSVWAGISSDVVARRGAAACALVKATMAYRPVTLEVICGFNFSQNTKVTGVIVVEIDPRTLDLSMLAFVLAHPGFLRRVMFDAAGHINDAVGDLLPRAEHARYINALNPDKHTITMPPIWDNSEAAPFSSDKSAAKWVQEKIGHVADVIAGYAETGNHTDFEPGFA